jgi:hypothetical protein
MVSVPLMLWGQGTPSRTPVRYQRAHSQNIIISENIENSHINGKYLHFSWPRDIWQISPNKTGQNSSSIDENISYIHTRILTSKYILISTKQEW